MMPNRNILLVEPNYKNKYPPIGLMKIATYHRILKDNVQFYKGDIKEFAIKLLAEKCIQELSAAGIDSIDKDLVYQYIRTRRTRLIQDAICSVDETENQNLVISILHKYKTIYWQNKFDEYPKFDRIYISTLFTFYWDITINTINFCKKFVKNISDIYIGGVMATVLCHDVEEETGVVPVLGLIDKPGILDNNDIIVDALPLDYSILKDTDYQYPSHDAYYGYLTRGCIRKCPFCAVRIIEPQFHEFISFKQHKKYVDENFGEQRNMLLLDNNVLASNQFSAIIDEIVSMGFGKGAVYKRKNSLPIYLEKIALSDNQSYYLKCAIELLSSIGKKSIRLKECLADVMEKYEMGSVSLLTKDILFQEADNINAALDDYFAKRKPIARFVDFNQGVDARLIDDEKMQLLGRIAIKPLRIAFDNIKFKDIYVRAIKLAAQNGIKDLSNYVLYNEKDSPEELYERLKINVELCEELNINIYSFPMKFHPIEGSRRFDRNYLGEKWSRKHVRAIQTILNATKGKVGRGESFFREAFGATLSEFMEILYMPEPFILYRKFFRDMGLTEQWRSEFCKFKGDSLEQLKIIIGNNDFSQIETQPEMFKKVLKYYTIKREDIAINIDKTLCLKKNLAV